jgi:hypothetical protein
MARLEGFEPPTFSFEGCRSIHLSYRRTGLVYPILPLTERHAEAGVTSSPLARRPSGLYPASYRAEI